MDAPPPEYVKLVTAACRKAADDVQLGGFNEGFVDALLLDLKKVYNRSHSSGYYLGRPQGWSRAYDSKATHQKIFVGKVTRYYSKIGVAEIKASRAIELGSDFLIIGNTTGVVEGNIDSIHLDQGAVESVKSGDTFSIRVADRVRPKDCFFLFQPVEAQA